MNKTITIYELLGMIKDGKAPKKIKHKNENEIYYYHKEDLDYYTDDREEMKIYLFNNHTNFILNDEVEILEEKKIPKKLDLPKKFEIGGCNVRIGSLGFVPTKSVVIDAVLSKMNDVIDYLDYLKSEGE